MIWEHWLVAISIGIIAIAFLILVIFVIIILMSIKQLINDFDQKVHALDSVFRVVSKAGNLMEKKADKHLIDTEPAIYKESVYKKNNNGVNTAMEVAEWALIGLALWQKIKERRR